MSALRPTNRPTACIFCNGELGDSRVAERLAARADLLIAADGGAEHLVALGMKPHAIIGDMDSLRCDPWRDDHSIKRITFPTDKDRSDAELAVEWAMEQGCGRALLLAAWGGRLDHALGNGALLIRFAGRLALWHDGTLVQGLRGGQRAHVHATPGTGVSIIPLADETRVRTSGLRYPLNDEPLEHATHGLSNVSTKAGPSVAVTHGLILLCVESDEWPGE